jgi:hypothetical protein
MVGQLVEMMADDLVLTKVVSMAVQMVWSMVEKMAD